MEITPFLVAWPCFTPGNAAVGTFWNRSAIPISYWIFVQCDKVGAQKIGMNIAK
jgi:hypothetical protein